ncbi:hypothetical protein PWT90_07392 [Aphanocladium album]|nr:hypothetical protein PWT90_07392 [Aphanocladium album]
MGPERRVARLLSERRAPMNPDAEPSILPAMAFMAQYCNKLRYLSSPANETRAKNESVHVGVISLVHKRKVVIYTAKIDGRLLDLLEDPEAQKTGISGIDINYIDLNQLAGVEEEQRVLVALGPEFFPKCESKRHGQ